MALKTTYFILLVLTLSACSHNKIRFVKVPRHVKHVQESSNAPSKKTSTFDTETEQSEFQESELSEESTEPVELNEATEPTEERSIYVNTQNPPDSTEQPNKQEIIGEAMFAADEAYRAKRMFVTAWATAIATGAFPPIFIASLVFYIIGTIKYNRVQQMRYITEEGQYELDQARKHYIVASILIGLTILAAAIIFVALFL